LLALWRQRQLLPRLRLRLRLLLLLLLLLLRCHIHFHALCPFSLGWASLCCIALLRLGCSGSGCSRCLLPPLPLAWPTAAALALPFLVSIRWNYCLLLSLSRLLLLLLLLWPFTLLLLLRLPFLPLGAWLLFLLLSAPRAPARAQERQSGSRWAAALSRTRQGGRQAAFLLDDGKWPRVPAR